MQKPNGYDEVKAGGDYTPIELGGHHAVIMGFREQLSSTGRNMAVVSIEFAKNDKQAGYFKEQFDNDTRQDKKWPYQGTQYILSEDQDGKCSKQLKSFITAFQDSNNTEVVWGEDKEKFAKQFKSKKIGVVFGEVEEEYNGEIKTRHRIRWFCNDVKVDSQNVPNKKYLQNKPAAAANYDDADFTKVPEGEDDEIPF